MHPNLNLFSASAPACSEIHFLSNSSQRKQQGYVVITAILFASLVTLVLSGMLWQQSRIIGQLHAMQDRNQASAYADAAQQWAKAILAEDRNASRIDHLQEIWAMPLAATRFEGAEISGKISDQQAALNLNNLIIANQLNTLNLRNAQTVLRAADLPDTLAESIADWIDADTQMRPHGAEDAEYQKIRPDALTANQPLLQIAELGQIKGITASHIQRLQGWINVLPAPSPININTASAEVLQLAVPQITPELAQNIVKLRREAAFTDLADFRQRIQAPDVPVYEANIAVSSRYFLVSCTVRFGQSSVAVESLLMREDHGWPSRLWRRSG